jgi:hypothetical protein
MSPKHTASCDLLEGMLWAGRCYGHSLHSSANVMSSQKVMIAVYVTFCG